VTNGKVISVGDRRVTPPMMMMSLHGEDESMGQPASKLGETFCAPHRDRQIHADHGSGK